MSKYNIHSDLKKYRFLKPVINIPILSISNFVSKRITKNMKVNENIKRSFTSFLSFDNREIDVYVFEPKDIEENCPVLLYFHGGGFLMESAPMQINGVSTYAEISKCKVFFINYRLAPTYPFPTGVEDCYSSLLWLYENAEKFKIDKNRIALGGDSAGGGLAAAVAQMARDMEGPEVIFQMLIYPVTDSRQETESIKEFVNTPLWNSTVNKVMWELYLKDGVKGNKAYAAPNEAEDFSNLPSTYLEVAEFDCLRDEGLEYAKSLEEAGVEVKVREVKGVIHGFEIAKDSDYTKEVIKSRGEILKEAFEKQKSLYRLT